MANHQFVVITSLPFVHTARRSYRLSNPVNISDRDLSGQLVQDLESQVNLIA